MTQFIIAYKCKHRSSLSQEFVTIQGGRSLKGALDNFTKRRPDIIPQRIARVSGTWHKIEYVPEPQWRIKE